VAARIASWLRLVRSVGLHSLLLLLPVRSGSLECLEAGFAAATQFYAFPRAHWEKIRSTNGMERLHVEIKRRTRAVGAFPDRTSALRLIAAVVLRATAVWRSRHYLAGFEPGKQKELQ